MKTSDLAKLFGPAMEALERLNIAKDLLGSAASSDDGKGTHSKTLMELRASSERLCP